MTDLVLRTESDEESCLAVFLEHTWTPAHWNPDSMPGLKGRCIPCVFLMFQGSWDVPMIPTDWGKAQWRLTHTTVCEEITDEGGRPFCVLTFWTRGKPAKNHKSLHFSAIVLSCGENQGMETSNCFPFLHPFAPNNKQIDQWQPFVMWFNWWLLSCSSPSFLVAHKMILNRCQEDPKLIFCRQIIDNGSFQTSLVDVGFFFAFLQFIEII